MVGGAGTRLGWGLVVVGALISRAAMAVPDGGDGGSAPIAVPSATPASTPLDPATGTTPGDATGTVSGVGDPCVQCAESLQRTLNDLKKITDAGLRKPFGEVANAVAKRMDVEHDLKITERGCGKFIGTKAFRGPDVPADVKAADCTTYVVDVLRDTFRLQGKSAEFNRVMARAIAASPNGLKGTELIKALQMEQGWTAIFWAPDTSTSDAGGEHRYAAHVAKTKGTYYKIPVDVTKSILNYRPEDASKTPDLTNIERLKKLPFAVLAAKGGSHMSLVLDGKVYEVHWSDGCESMRLIEDTELQKWGWNSGVLAGPKAEVDAAWGTR